MTTITSPEASDLRDEEEAREIAVEAYIYLYPLVMMDVTRRQATNRGPGQVLGRGSMMTFTHVPTFPPADFRDVVRPNFDTLYSIAWLDVTEEPAILDVPDAAGRYYLLPMLDMWTDVFASPGKRTTGTGAARFAVVPQGWQGTLPDGVQRIDTPTPYVWLIGRTQTNGPADYAAVHQFQDGLRTAPLSRADAPQQPQQPQQPGTFQPDPTVDMQTPPLRQVNRMTGVDYFTYAAELMRQHPPHVTDQAMIARMRRLGLRAGDSFDAESADPVVRQVLEAAPAAGLAAMNAKLPTLARVANGWQLNTDTMGVYGDYYLKRATVAMFGLGANQPEDAVYPLNLADSEGRPLNGAHDYVLHFDPAELPPVHAFWSITLYDDEGFPVANHLNRLAVGDRDPLTYNADGSLDLHIQHADPGPDKQSNWLPTPAGSFNLTARLYWPKPEVLDGRWAPPAVRAAG
jgi:hypothetical protein